MGGHGKNKPAGTGKKIAFFTIGTLTLLYCLGELAVALYINSLALLSDGFHNLSDVVSLYIAWWAQNAAQRDQSDDMSYGWGRTEILGGLSNGCFLLSLCLYVTLEAIPKMIRPEADGLDCTGALSCERVYELFILVAAVGLFVNTVGTIVFAFVGLSHGHSHAHGHGHGHGHGEKSGGHSHGHSHGHGKKKAKKDKVKGVKGTKKEAQSLLGNINDDESDIGDITSESESEHEHDDHEHDHDHAHGHDHGHSHGHKHEKKKDKSHKDGHSHGHGHGHGEKKHDHGEKKQKDKGMKHMHEKKKKKKGGFFAKMDLNMGAVFIHYLGDTVSSLVVLGTGFLLHYLKGSWINYIDPVSSLVIVVLIVASTVPLVKRCSMILLQSTPEGIEPEAVRKDIAILDHVVSIHDLHIWQLVDGMVIASVHLLVEETGNLGDVLYHVKKIFHAHGIHSSSIQPEIVPVTTPKQGNFCAQNCVEECEEDWCCKNTAERTIAAATTV